MNEVYPMNMKKWLDDCLNNPRKDPLPILSFPGIQLLDMTVSDLVRDGEKQALCMKAIADRYATLAAVSNMDLSVEAEAFGAETRFDDDEVPNIIGRLVDTAEDAKTLRIPAVGTARTKECIKAITLAKSMIKDRPILAGIIGPFSLAGRLLEMAEIMYKAIDDPDMVHEVLDKVTTFLLNYSLALKAAGADGIMMAEPAAGLLSPAWNAEFSADYVARIIEAVQDDHFLVVYHNCGNVLPLVDDLVATGARAFHFGNVISMKKIMDKMPADCLVMGNIDPVTQFSHGTPESIAAATAELMNEMKGYKNFVLSSGCDIPPMTPMANIDAFFQSAKDEGKTNTF
jgi:uroporphyrinogen decarboxylase